MTYQQPDAKGFYGKFGGQFVPETLMTAVIELDKAYREAKGRSKLKRNWRSPQKTMWAVRRLLYHAKRLTDHIGGAQFTLNEDLNHTGAHKINNALGQVLLAKRMGKKKIIAETGCRSTRCWQQRQPQLFSTWTSPLFIWVKRWC